MSYRELILSLLFLLVLPSCQEKEEEEEDLGRMVMREEEQDIDWNLAKELDKNLITDESFPLPQERLFREETSTESMR